MVGNIVILDSNNKLKKIINKYTDVKPILVNSIKEFEKINKKTIAILFFNIEYDKKKINLLNKIRKIVIIPKSKKMFNINYMGNVDFVSYPFNKEEVLARLRLHSELINIKKNNINMQKFTNSLVSTLINISLKNDIETGEHIERVRLFSEALASEYGCDKEFIENIRTYAPLHDIGKIGIPDKILKKPGKYNNEEFEKMQFHVKIGKEILESSNLPQMSKDIVLYHHEKWNGDGYLYNLSYDEIPLSARIVALSDVYDALTHKRVYKPAFSQEKATKIIKEDKGKHFDPDLVDDYLNIKDRFVEIRKSNLD